VEHTYLGVQHTLEKDGPLKLGQQMLLNDLFDKMIISSATRTLTSSVQHPPRIADPDAPCDATEYRSLVGIMQFLLKSRPDVAYVISDASTHNSNPTKKDRAAVQTIGQYLYNTREFGLTLPTGVDPASKIPKLTCWVDASYLTHTNSISHTGYFFSLGQIGMFYSKSSVQSLVATSLSHAEMRALFTAVRDIIFLIDLFTELGFAVEKPVDVHEDNAACVILAGQHF
jgi:hypothetical protein